MAESVSRSAARGRFVALRTVVQTVSKEQLATALQTLASSREDQQAWQIIFLGAWGTGLSAANRVLRGQLDLAKDVTQEALGRIIKYCDFEELQDPDAFLSYFRAVSRNVARDALSRLAPELAGQIPMEELDFAGLPKQGSVTPEQLLRAEELRNELLDRLEPPDQELMMFLLEGYSLSEMAKLLGLSYSNTGIRLHRLRLVLRKYLTDKGF